MSATKFSRLAFSCAAALTLASSGCGLLDQLGDQYTDDGSVISVFVTHHASSDGMGFPPRQGAPQFLNDMGWDVLLADAFITTQGATFHSCQGAVKRDLEMYWGALPEDINELDLTTTPVGGVPLDSGDWCGLTVRYGPFMPGEDGDYQMPNPAAIGTTIYLRGLATKDGQMVPFEVSVSEPISVLVSMTDIARPGPLQVTDGNNPKVTISKNYDRLFDTVDFANYTDQELKDLVLASLGEQTLVSLGTMVAP